MTKQTEAQDLIRELEDEAQDNPDDYRWKAAAELRRLEAANEELLEALEAFVARIEWGAKISGTEGYLGECADKARAAIKNHGGAA